MAKEETVAGRGDAWASYCNARSNGKTKLSFPQWLLVRTPEFKAWFWDWEAASRQERIRGIINSVFSEKDAKKREIIAENRDADPSGKLSQVFGFPVRRQYLTPDDMRKINNRHGVGNENEEGQIGLTEDDYVKAYELLRDPETFKKGHSRNGKPSAEFGHEFSDGTLVVTEVEVAEEGAVSVKSVWKKVPGRRHAGASPFESLSSGTAAAGVRSIVHSDTLLVNPSTISKITDPETGEPVFPLQVLCKCWKRHEI